MTFNSCQDDEIVVVDEPEVITTMIFTLTPTTGDVVTLMFEDLDGNGGNAPTVTTGALAVNEIYTGSIALWNQSLTPAENIGEEVAEEDDEHQFFFQSTVAGLTVEYGDNDDNGNPLGLLTTVSTGVAGTGTLTVTLRHEPDKNAAGVSDGSIDNAGGETDIEVTFPIDVQ